MAKVGRWSTTAANNNSTPPDGWPEGQAPSTVNDCAREMMAQIRTMLNDMSFIDLDHSPTQTTSTTFTIPGNVVSFYDIGRRVKAFDATTLYGTVISSSFTTNTGVTLRLDSGVLTSSLTSVAVSVLGNTNRAIPDTAYRIQNALINGPLDFWSRGVTFNLSGSAAIAYTADRWQVRHNAASSINVTKQERSANASNVPTLAQVGYLLNNSLCISVSAVDAAIAGSDFCVVRTTIEGYDWARIGHKPNMFGFWVNSNRTGTYCVAFGNAGPGGVTDRCYVAEYAISAANTWEKKTFAIPEAVTTGTWDYSTGAGLHIYCTLAAGTTYQTNANTWTASIAIATSNQTNFLASAGHTIKFADFKYYEGNSELPVPMRPAAEEKNRINRYMWAIANGSGVNEFIGTGVVTATTRVDAVVVKMPQEMRIAPSISAIGGTVNCFDGGVAQPITKFSSDYSTVFFWSRLCVLSAGGMTAGRPAQIAVGLGTTVVFDADFT